MQYGPLKALGKGSEQRNHLPLAEKKIKKNSDYIDYIGK